VCTYQGLILAGVEGSLRYREGVYQYTQSQMWQHVFSLVPALLYNHVTQGRYMDVFVSHAPPAGIHDQADLPHQGIKAFHWLIDVFKPRYFFHGHVHIYKPYEAVSTDYNGTRVVNTYGFRETDIEIQPSFLRSN
jgi:Icc-related predicted phosphoesterase